MTREEAIDFLECRRAYYISLSTDPNPHVKATKVCGYTLAESANACLMATKALEQEPCSNCCNGNQVEKAKLCQKSYLAGMEHKQEPKTGHWIDDCGGVKCSCCGYRIDDCFYAKTYCTNCGCRMEGEVAECH